jgi:diguanylate cyclase (GGDEF)-like protein
MDSLLEMAVEKAAAIFDKGFGMIYLAKDDYSDFIPKIESGEDAAKLRAFSIKRKGHGILEKAVESRNIFTIDSTTKLTKEAENFKAACGIENILVIPIYSGRSNFGILLIGVREDDYKFKGEDVELVKVFAKQITIAIESDMLSKRTEALSIKDDLTDLYNKKFILDRLGEEIKRSIFYQRPCSFLVFGVDGFDDFRSLHGELATEEALRKMAKVIKDNMNPIGKAARVAGDEFAVLLPEKNKKESFAIAEEIRKKVESVNFLKSGNASLTVSGGVSENPLDGATSDELFKKAGDLLREARRSGKNRVIM